MVWANLAPVARRKVTPSARRATLDGPSTMKKPSATVRVQIAMPYVEAVAFPPRPIFFRSNQICVRVCAYDDIF